jgi:hypothetical protein
MSMAINRVSANTVAAMLYPVMKPSRVPKVGSGRTSSSASTSTTQSTSRPQPADAAAAEPVHAAFEYARVALSSLGTTPAAAPSNTEGQAGGVQQAGSAYTQVEQQAGQALDITA